RPIRSSFACSVFRNAALKPEVRHLPFQLVSQKTEQANELLIGLLQVRSLQKRAVCFQKGWVEVHWNASFSAASLLSSIPHPAAKEGSAFIDRSPGVRADFI